MHYPRDVLRRVLAREHWQSGQVVACLYPEREHGAAEQQYLIYCSNKAVNTACDHIVSEKVVDKGLL